RPTTPGADRARPGSARRGPEPPRRVGPRPRRAESSIRGGRLATPHRHGRRRPSGTHHLRSLGGRPLRRQGPPDAAPPRGPPTVAPDRPGGGPASQPPGDGSRPPRCRGADKRRDRRTTRPLPSYRREPPRPRLRPARHLVAGGAGPLGDGGRGGLRSVAPDGKKFRSSPDEPPAVCPQTDGREPSRGGRP